MVLFLTFLMHPDEHPPSPREVEECVRAVLRLHPDIEEGVVSTDSMGPQMVIRVRDMKTAEGINTLLNAISSAVIQVSSVESAPPIVGRKRQLTLHFGREEE